MIKSVSFLSYLLPCESSFLTVCFDNVEEVIDISVSDRMSDDHSPPTLDELMQSLVSTRSRI